MVLADDHLAHLAHDAIPELVHCVLPSFPPTRAITRPERQYARVVGDRCEQRRDLVVGAAQRPRRGPRSRRRSVRRRPGARRDAGTCPLLGRRQRAGRSCVRSRLTDSACTYSARAGGRSRAFAIGRTEPAGARPHERERGQPDERAARPSSAPGSRRCPGSRRTRARLRGTRPVGSRRPRAPARTRRCRRPARNWFSSGDGVGEEEDLAPPDCLLGEQRGLARADERVSAARGRPRTGARGRRCCATAPNDGSTRSTTCVPAGDQVGGSSLKLRR